MADNPAASTSATSRTSVETVQSAPPRGSSRALLLVAVLVAMVGWYAYDYFVAREQSLAAGTAIQTLADERNKQGIKSEDGTKLGDGRVTSADIQKAIGRAPYSTKKEKHYTVETYWWYSMPHRNYVTVLYVGNEPRRYNTHYLNAQPDSDDLPTEIELPPPTKGDANAAEETSASTETGSSSAETDQPQSEPAAETKNAPDEPAAEAPKADEPKADEPKADEPKADEPKAEEPKAEEPKADEAKAP